MNCENFSKIFLISFINIIIFNFYSVTTTSTTTTTTTTLMPTTTIKSINNSKLFNRTNNIVHHPFRNLLLSSLLRKRKENDNSTSSLLSKESLLLSKPYNPYNLQSRRQDQQQQQQHENEVRNYYDNMNENSNDNHYPYYHTSNQNVYMPIATWNNNNNNDNGDQIASMNLANDNNNHPNVYSLLMSNTISSIHNDDDDSYQQQQQQQTTSSNLINDDSDDDVDLLQMSDTNRKSKILSTGNRFHSPPSSSSSQSQHSTNKQKQQQQSSPLGIILGRPMTNGFDGRLYIPIFYPKSWIVPSTSVQRQPIRTIVPMQYSSSNSYHSYYSYPSKFLYSKINNPTPTMYRQSPAAFESFIGQTFQLPDKTTTLDTKTNTEMDHRHDPSSMSFILQQLDQNLLQQQYQETKQQQQINVEKNSKPTKKSFTNLLKSLGKFASISPSSSSTSSENTRSSSSEAMIADGSEQIEPYHPYPLKHIGGPYYVGPPILGIHDPDAELKLAMSASNNVLDQNGDGFMDNFLMNTAENTMDDTSDDVNSYYYGLEHADNEFTTPTLIDQFNPSTSSILSRTESNIQTPLESNRISISSIKSNRTIRNNLNRQSRKKFKTTSKPNYSYQEETTLNPLKSVIEPSSSSSSWKAIISTTTTTTSTTTESPFNKNSMIPLNISNISPQSQWIPTVAARKHNSLKDTNVFKFPISF